MNSTTELMNWLLEKLKNMRNYLIIILTVILVSCSDKNDQPENPLPVQTEIVKKFNQFDPDFDGFAYFDVKAMSVKPEFEDFSKTVDVTYKEKLKGSKRDLFLLLKAVEFDPLIDAESYSVVLYSGEMKNDFAMSISGNFDIENWKKNMRDSGWSNSKLNGSDLWMSDVNNQYYFRFSDSKTLLLTTNPSLINSNSKSSEKVQNFLDSRFSDLTLRNQGVFYFAVPKNINKKMFKFDGNKGIKFEMDSPPREVKGIFYLNDGAKLRSEISFVDEDGLFASSQLLKVVLGFQSMKSFFNNETSLMDFMDIDRKDSTMTVTIDIPQDKILKLAEKR